MWPILLLLAVAQCSAEEHEQNIVGCSKHDQQMDYDQYSSKSLPKFNVTYGKRVPAKVFNRIKDVKEFIDSIQGDFEKTIEMHTVNDIDEFIRFYNQVKDDRIDESFQNFYERGFQSDTSFQEDRNRLSSDPMRALPYYKFAPRLMSDICNEYKVMDNCYLVAVYKKSPRKVETKSSQTYYDLSHIAGAIRIEVRGRPGVILMDIGDNAFKPVVLMNDLKYPHKYSWNSERSVEKITILSPRYTTFMGNSVETPEIQVPNLENQLKNFIEKRNRDSIEFRYAGKTFSFEFKKNNKYVIVRNKYENDSETIYDIERPYCSFLSTTVSRYLYLKTTKSVVKRDGYGKIIASVSFDLTEKDPKKLKFVDGRGKQKTVEFADLKHLFFEMEPGVSHPIGNYYSSFRLDINLDRNIPLKVYLEKVVDIAKNKQFMEKYEKYLTEMTLLNQYKINLGDVPLLNYNYSVSKRSRCPFSVLASVIKKLK